MRYGMKLAIGLCVGVICLASLKSVVVAEERKMTDLRDGTYTSEEVGQALFPMTPRGLPKPGTSTPKPEVTSVALNIHFDFNSATIQPKHHAELEKLAAALTAPQYTDYRVRIEGHTDSIGPEDYNEALSERRAISVKEYLVDRFNVDPNRLVVKGMGEGHPILANDTETDRSKNRRVEVVNLGL